MRSFFAAFLGFLAAGMVLLGVLLVFGGWDALQRQVARFGDPLHRDARALRVAETEVQAARAQNQSRRAEREQSELREQRRERLALLFATLRTAPMTSVAATETHLFQQAERERARGSSADALFIELVDPVQIDEWTVLQPGTAVELVRADRDNVITIRHEGAHYQISPCQTELRYVAGASCAE